MVGFVTPKQLADAFAAVPELRQAVRPNTIVLRPCLYMQPDIFCVHRWVMPTLMPSSQLLPPMLLRLRAHCVTHSAHS